MAGEEGFFFALIPHGQSRHLADFFWRGRRVFFFRPYTPRAKSRLSRFFFFGGGGGVFFFALTPHGQSRDLADFFWRGRRVVFFALIPHGQSRDLADFFLAGEEGFFFRPYTPRAKSRLSRFFWGNQSKERPIKVTNFIEFSLPKNWEDQFKKLVTQDERHEAKNIEVSPWEQPTMNCLARRISTWSERQDKRNTLVSPWEQSTVNCLARRTSTRTERHEAKKMKSNLENSPQWTVWRGELQRKIRHDKRNTLSVYLWEQSTVNCLAGRTSTRSERHGTKKMKSNLENSPQWTVWRGELQCKMKDTTRERTVSPWEQSTVNCLARRTSTWNERHEDDKARNHSNVRTFLVRNCYEPCFKSSPDGVRIEDARRSTFLHRCNIQLNASPKSVCIMSN